MELQVKKLKAQVDETQNRIVEYKKTIEINNKLLNNESHEVARYQKLNQTQTKEYEEKISKLEKELHSLKESQKIKTIRKNKN